MHERGTEKAVLTFGQITSKIWDLGLLVFTFNFSGVLEGSIIPQFMYTRVHCCEEGGTGLPAQYDITDPALVRALEDEAEALSLPLDVSPAGRVAACDVPSFPHGSPLWSMSEFCVNRAYVQESTQHTLGLTAPLQKAIIFLILPIGAAMSDSVGRRPMVGIYAVVSLIGCILLVVDSHLASVASGNMCLLVAGFLLLGAGGEPKDSIMVSSVADVLGHDEVNKSRAMYLIFACTTSAILASTSLNYIVERHKLTSWEIPWIIFTLVAGLVLLQCVLTLRETLPEELRLPFDWRKLNPVASWQRSLGVVFGDWIIVVSFCMEFIHTFAASGMSGISMPYLIVVGFGPDSAMLVGIVAAAVQVLAALCMVPLVVKLGVFRALSLSFVLQAAGHLVNGAPTLARPGMAYLGGVLVPAGMAIYKPSQLTVVSQRVERANQGKLMGGFAIANVLAVLCSSPIFSFVLFKANATGPRLALPVYVAASASVLNFFLTLYVAHAAPRIPSAYDMDKDPQQSEATALESGGDGKPALSSYGATDTAAA